MTCVPDNERNDSCRLNTSVIDVFNESNVVVMNLKRTISAVRVGGLGYRHVRDILTKSYYRKHLVRTK